MKHKKFTIFKRFFLSFAKFCQLLDESRYKLTLLSLNVASDGVSGLNLKIYENSSR